MHGSGRRMGTGIELGSSRPFVVSHIQRCSNKHQCCVGSYHTIEEYNVIRTRRLVSSLIVSSLVSLPVQQCLATLSDTKEIRRVRPGENILDVIDQSPPGSVIYVEEGEYTIDTTLEIRKPLCIRGQSRGQSIISLSTHEPYRPVFQVSSASGVTLENMTIRHQSPSVANNYAVYLQNAGDCIIQNMDISSSTGTGVTVEGIQQGATIRIQNCTIHDCAKNGLGIFPSIEDTASTAEAEIVVQGMRIEHNQGHGIVIKGMQDSRVTIVDDNEIHLNRLYGLQLSDSENVYCISSKPQDDECVSKNGSGAIQVQDQYSHIHRQQIKK